MFTPQEEKILFKSNTYLKYSTMGISDITIKDIWTDIKAITRLDQTGIIILRYLNELMVAKDPQYHYLKHTNINAPMNDSDLRDYEFLNQDGIKHATGTTTIGVGGASADVEMVASPGAGYKLVLVGVRFQLYDVTSGGIDYTAQPLTGIVKVESSQPTTLQTFLINCSWPKMEMFGCQHACEENKKIQADISALTQNDVLYWEIWYKILQV